MFFNSGGDSNVIEVVCRTLSVYQVKVRKATVIRYLQPHPDYPTLKSVCDLFKYIHLDYYPLKVEEKELLGLSKPFIAHSNEGGGKILLIYKVSKQRIVYADSCRGRNVVSTKSFLELWSGVVILLEPTEKSGEKDYKDNKRDELSKNAIVPFVFFLFLFTCLYGLVLNIAENEIPSGKFIILILIKFTGVIISLLLFISELDIHNTLTDKLCHVSTNVNCNAVTRSGASKIFGVIGWADIGVAYFCSGLLLLFNLSYTEVIPLLSIFAVAAVPYPIFSVLYQGLKVRKWCPLCLSVQALLISEFILLVNSVSVEMITIRAIGMTLIIFGIVLVIICLIKVLYTSNKEAESLHLRLAKVKRDPLIFSSQLKRSRKKEIPVSKYSLIVGDKESRICISVFLSFYCTYCAKMYKSVMALIDNGVKIRIRLIFGAPTDELSKRMTVIICSFLEQGQTMLIARLIEEWYVTDQKQRERTLYQDHIFKENKFVSEFILFNSELFKANKIHGVPAAFVNGYPLPHIYDLEDLKLFAEEIESEVFETTEAMIQT
jgi:hypothetical protein